MNFHIVEAVLELNVSGHSTTNSLILIGDRGLGVTWSEDAVAFTILGVGIGDLRAASRSLPVSVVGVDLGALVAVYISSGFAVARSDTGAGASMGGGKVVIIMGGTLGLAAVIIHGMRFGFVTTGSSSRAWAHILDNTGTGEGASLERRDRRTAREFPSGLG